MTTQNSVSACRALVLKDIRVTNDTTLASSPPLPSSPQTHLIYISPLSSFLSVFFHFLQTSLNAHPVTLERIPEVKLKIDNILTITRIKL